MKKLMFLIMFIIGSTIFASYTENLTERMSLVEEKIQKVYDKPNVTDAEMTKACELGRKAWDNELNTVYQLLMKKLSKEYQELLRKEERQWIKDRDKAAKEAGDEFKGGTLEPLIITSTLLEETKARTIQLAEMYDSF
ncbi:MAG: lysozyme inhibitor LprI family protein [Fusobacteriaceae bacterium]|jgi:uncharacterized protein YecT (DUF1311 family)|nr:lysozyme inhibitor LprI family protein [Fusobacteriaceae bacterium]